MRTVGDLRKALLGVDDSLELIVRAWDDDNCVAVPYQSAQVEHDHGDGPDYFAIDGYPEEEAALRAAVDEAVGKPEPKTGRRPILRVVK